MSSARKYVEKFSALFSGNSEFHGVHVPEHAIEGKKAKGKSFTRREPLEPKHFIKHLLGEESIGVVPLNADGNINFAVLDVDIYPLDPKSILLALKRAKLPLMGFRSKSGGLHLYCFFKTQTSAATALPLIAEVRQALGLSRATEIFPKQTKLMGDAVGNWINLPYFNFNNTVRYAYDSEGEELHIGDAIAQAWASRTTLSELKGLLQNMPLAQAPPCLQTLFLGGGAEEGARNAFLFNCATYLKARFGEGFSENLHLLNRKMESPLAYEELDRTVISSHNKGDYHYQCSSATLMEYCDKEVCGNRKYGKGVGQVSDISFEQLTQVQCSKPYYKWLINGEEMVFHSEADLLNQNRFRELCLRHLHTVPARLKDKAWADILNRGLSNLVTIEEQDDNDMSEDSMWLSKVGEFFSLRRAVRPSQIEEGLVYHNGNGQLHFKAAKILEHLEKSGLFKHFKMSQHRKLLSRLGAKKAKLRYSDIGKTARTWTINLSELHERHLFTDIAVEEDDYLKEFKPLDFIGKEKY